MGSKNTTGLPATTSIDRGKAGISKFDSQDLFQGQQEICIEHADQVYRLRITRQGKLILTK